MVNRSWPLYEDADGNFKLGQDEIKYMFEVLSRAVRKGDVKGLKTQKVFALVQKICEDRKKTKDDFKCINSKSIGYL